jgi:hypothetical protein
MCFRAWQSQEQHSPYCLIESVGILTSEDPAFMSTLLALAAWLQLTSHARRYAMVKHQQ